MKIRNVTWGRWALVLSAAGAVSLCLAQVDSTQPAQAPGVQISEQVIRDSNLFRVPADLDLRSTVLGRGATRDDIIDQTSLGASGDWTSGRQRLTLLATLDDNRFEHNSQLDNLSGHAALNDSWSLRQSWSGQAGVDYQRTLASFVTTRFLGKDLFTTTTYSGGARYQIGPRWSLHAEGQYADNQHGSTARQVDDFQSRSGTLGIDYQTGAGNTLGWDYRRTRASFPAQALVNGLPFDRNYREDTGRFNLKYAFTETTTLQASTGFLRREYPQTPAGRFSGGVWNASLDWQPRSKLRITAAAWRELRAYLDAQSDHFVSRAQSVSAAWMPRRSLTLSLDLTSEAQDYLGAGLTASGLAATSLAGAGTASASVDPHRADRIRSGEVRVSWQSVHRLSLEVAGRLEHRDSALSQFQYDDASVRVGLDFHF